MKKISLILLIIFLFFPISLYADNISVLLELERNEISLIDSVKMSVTVKGTRSADSPQIYGLNNFDVEAGGSSSQMQIINGQVQSSVELSYYLQPKRIGTFNIGPVRLKIGGTIFTSNTVSLAVKKETREKGSISDPIFLISSISSKQMYTEEQVKYTLKLYHIPIISNVSLSLPDTNNITLKQLGKPSEYETVYNSKKYQVVEINYTFVPEKQGQFKIDPAKMSMIAQLQGRNSGKGRDDFFAMDDFFRARGRAITAASNSIDIEVLPVPEAGKPNNYSGLIGSFNISAALEPKKIKAGESSTLTIIIKGSGNTNRIPDLKIPDIENIKVYADEPAMETQITQNGIEGVKTMKWAIVPEKDGEYVIPGINLSFFNTNNKQYKTIKSTSFNLSVDPGTGQIDYSKYEKKHKQTKEEISMLGSDIFPIHTTVKNLSGAAESLSGWLKLIILIFPCIAFSFIYAGSKYSKQNSRNIAQIKAGKASGIIQKKCKGREITASELSYALRIYINDRFGMELGAITPGDAVKALSEKGVSGVTVKKMEALLKNVENRIYTGKGGSQCGLGHDTMEIIKNIEKEIK